MISLCEINKNQTKSINIGFACLILFNLSTDENIDLWKEVIKFLNQEETLIVFYSVVPVANLNGNKKKTNAERAALLNMSSVEGHKFTSFCNYSVLPSLNKVYYYYYYYLIFLFPLLNYSQL